MHLPQVLISRREWLLVGWLAGLAVVAGSWPWLTAQANQLPGSTWLGTNIPDVLDSQVYYAFIQANADGQTLYANLFTSETQSVVLFHPLWWLLGRVVAWTGWSPVTVFWGAKAIFGLGLIFFLYYLVARFFVAARWRLLALGLAIFGGGLGSIALLGLSVHPGLIWIYQRTDLASVLPIDVTYSAGYVWLSILHSPLYTVSIGLMLFVWFGFIQSLTKKRWIIWAGFASLLLGFIHPYDVIIVVVGIIAALVIGIQGNLINQDEVKQVLRRLGQLAIWMVPPTLYYLAIIIFAPTVREWNSQNVLQTTNLRTVIAGLAPAIFFAVIGVVMWWRKQPRLIWLPLAWAATGLMLIYAPFIQYQAKMIAGMSIPLAILTTAGVQTYWQRPRKSRGIPRIIVTAFLLFTLILPIYFLVRVSASQRHEARYHYIQTDLLSALHWLRIQTPPGSVILGDVWTGNLVPQFAARPTYLGHLHQTAHFDQKLRTVRDWFFEDQTDVVKKQAWLREARINYLIYGPYERAQGGLRPEDVPGLSQVFSRGLVSVYRVETAFGE